MTTNADAKFSARLEPLLLLGMLGVCLAAYWAAKNARTALPAEPAIGLFLERAVSSEEMDRNFTDAKYEPRWGCYLGAYIDLDPALKDVYTDQTGKVRRIPEPFEEIVGKQHAMYFFYLGYGRDLPMDWVARLSERGRLVHIALEPNDGLRMVKDDAYLAKLAKDMGRSGAKIFLRFASEMNGPWTKYHGDPDLYIDKWRLIARKMRQFAPNVAMVWCPYTTPKRFIEAYYPGDDYVDWVGVNMYSVTYYNLRWYQPGKEDHPIDLLRWMYTKYAPRKPLMIAEYAATHFSALEDRPSIEFARECILALYDALPRQFPRVKCITYFNTNNLLLTHRKNNNYSLTDSRPVTEAYRQATHPPYYLSSAAQWSGSDSSPMAVRDGQELRGRLSLSIWARSPSRSGLVRLLIDGLESFRSTDLGRRSFVLDTALFPPGERELIVECFAPTGALAARQTLRVRFSD